MIARAWTVLLVLAVAAGDHGLGGLVTWLEKRAYAAQSPRVGGTPAHGIPPTAGVVDGPSSGSVPPLRPAAGPALPGEGQWRTVVAVHGRPAVQVPPASGRDAHLVPRRGDAARPRPRPRPAPPGHARPGGRWQASTSLAGAAGAAGAGVAAALNGGFRLTDPSHNGHYSEGRTVAPLVGGKASLVLHTDGTADVGSWNREVRMDPTVAGPAQGFPLFPDEQVPPQHYLTASSRDVDVALCRQPIRRVSFMCRLTSL